MYSKSNFYVLFYFLVVIDIIIGFFAYLIKNCALIIDIIVIAQPFDLLGCILGYFFSVILYRMCI